VPTVAVSQNRPMARGFEFECETIEPKPSGVKFTMTFNIGAMREVGPRSAVSGGLGRIFDGRFF
jgi:hypothetical protein